MLLLSASNRAGSNDCAKFILSGANGLPVSISSFDLSSLPSSLAAAGKDLRAACLRLVRRPLAEGRRRRQSGETECVFRPSSHAIAHSSAVSGPHSARRLAVGAVRQRGEWNGTVRLSVGVSQSVTSVALPSR